MDSLFAGSFDDTLFFEGTKGLSTNLHGDLFAVDQNCFGLQVRLPDLFSVALRKAYIAAVLFAFTSKFTDVHKKLLYR
jgi:hypothetical protein